MVGISTLTLLNKRRQGKKQMPGVLELVGLLKAEKEKMNSVYIQIHGYLELRRSFQR